MIFNSLEYAGFLVAVLAAYWRLGQRGQLRLLLVASYVFYGWWDARFLSLIVASTLLDFTIGLRIGASDDEQHRRRLLAASLVGNLGVLATFKYHGFFVDSAVDALAALGWRTAGPTLRILLPVGISFYTFQTISYSFDVFRRRVEPTADLLGFAVFVAFFPQLVAGPIERARHLLPQFQRERPRPRRSEIVAALALVGQGLVKKVVIADGLAPFVDDAFARSGTAGAGALVVGVVAFAFQIYGDFSGYTDIARGSARLLGVDLMENFRQPYLARSVTEFWHDWHISLSTWLRDYLYVPLGGNRRGRWRTYRNLLVTMALGGLWHGAAWTFVLWGTFHGLLLAVHRAAGRRHVEPSGVPSAREAPAVLGTFALVCVGWVLFRAGSVDQATEILAGIAGLRPGPVDVDALVSLVVLGGASLALDLVQRRTRTEAPVLRWPAVPAGAVAGAALVALIVFSGGDPVPFIYFRF